MKLLLRRAFIALRPEYGASVQVQIRRNSAVGTPETVPAGRTDLAAPDFSAFSFDGTAGVRWFPAAEGCGAGERFSLRFTIPDQSPVTVWGLRMIYEKGESVK